MALESKEKVESLEVAMCMHRHLVAKGGSRFTSEKCQYENITAFDDVPPPPPPLHRDIELNLQNNKVFVTIKQKKVPAEAVMVTEGNNL